MGVWNGWGYGIAFFRALNFQISEPEIWRKSLFLRNFRGFSRKIRPLKNIFGLWKMAIPYATNHTPTKCRPIKRKYKFWVFSGVFRCFQVSQSIFHGVFRCFFPIPFARIPFAPFQLSFLSLKFLNFAKDTPPSKLPRLFCLCRTHKIPGKDRENFKITKEIPCLDFYSPKDPPPPQKKKHKKKKRNKGKKGRSQGPSFSTTVHGRSLIR